MIYLHWPQDISLDALKELELALRDWAGDPHDALRNRKHVIAELQNVANEARAMIQKASIGAIKVERRPAPIDDDELLG